MNNEILFAVLGDREEILIALTFINMFDSHINFITIKDDDYDCIWYITNNVEGSTMEKSIEDLMLVFTDLEYPWKYVRIGSTLHDYDEQMYNPEDNYTLDELFYIKREIGIELDGY